LRYIGSKVTTLNSLYKIISKICPKGSFCDPFGGIGTVGSFFKMMGYAVTTGDILKAAHFFQVSKIVLTNPPPFKHLKAELGFKNIVALENYLNSLPPKSGWITKNFSAKRKFFSKRNAEKLDACWSKILKWKIDKKISSREEAFLAASLIDSADRIANTAGTYYAYLKRLSRKSNRPFKLKFLAPSSGKNGCKSYLYPAEKLVSTGHFDVLYLDPPYNERSYAHYYHFPETLATFDKRLPTGKSGIIQRPHPQSEFNRPKIASKALEALLEKASFNHLIFHYTDDGLISRSEITRILSEYGKAKRFNLTSAGYTTTKNSRSCKHAVYVVSNA
jgi:adenine-specific DNA-methyltransferase